MNNRNASEDIKLLNGGEINIQSLFNKMMQGFDRNGIAMTPKLNDEDGKYNMLYAPGYEDMGIGDVVAQCK